MNKKAGVLSSIGSVMETGAQPKGLAVTQHTVETPYMVGPVHCYTAELGGELVLFDTGPPTEVGQQFLEENIDLKRLKHVIVTHCHIDHYGQSSWLEQNSDAVVYLPYRDILKIRHHEERLDEMYRLLQGMGFAENYLEKLRDFFYRGMVFPTFPERYLVAERDIPEHLGVEVICCAGHSQSDLVYVVGGYAITGDTLLRGVYQSPLLDVDLENGGRFNNYQAYCSSIVKLSGLRGKHILPGHRRTIESIDGTILFYISKTLDRVCQLKSHIQKHAVAEIIDLVFKTMKDPFHIYLKSSEILFMSDFLDDPERLGQALEQIGLMEQVEDVFQRASA